MKGGPTQKESRPAGRNSETAGREVKSVKRVNGLYYFKGKAYSTFHEAFTAAVSAWKAR